MSQINNWKASPTDFATIIDDVTGKQVADFGSPEISEAECLRNFAIGLAGPAMLVALERAEFLMRRVSEGDHRALENLPDAAREFRDVIRAAGGRSV